MDSKLLPPVLISRILFKSSTILKIFCVQSWFSCLFGRLCSHTFHTLQQTLDDRSETIIWLPLSSTATAHGAHARWKSKILPPFPEVPCLPLALSCLKQGERWSLLGVQYILPLRCLKKYSCWIQPDLRGCGSTHPGGYSCLFSSCHFVHP